MSYQSTGALPKYLSTQVYKMATVKAVTPSAAQIAEMAAKNMIWVPASGSIRGHWETKKATGGRRATVTVRRVQDMSPQEQADRKARFQMMAKCKATGMPSQFIGMCVEGLKAGASLEEVNAAILAQAEAAAAQQADPGGISPAAVPLKKKFPTVLVLAAGGGLLAVLLLLRRKKT